MLGWSNLRQRIYPAAFRINAGPADELADSLALVMSEAFAAVRSRASAPPGPACAPRPIEEALPPPVEPRPPEKSSHGGVSAAFATELCNYHFRLSRNAGLLKVNGDSDKELRAVGRMLEKIDLLLKDYGIEWLDVTGQRYDDGREDFEPIGTPERVPGLSESRITHCERPAVMIDGKLVQKAKGLVRKPA
jgi:hypothetical protein